MSDMEVTIAADTSELNTRHSGELPCDELREIEPGHRVRFEITVRAPAQVECRDGYDPDFYWSILDGDGVAVEATPVNIPMRAKGTRRLPTTAADEQERQNRHSIWSGHSCRSSSVERASWADCPGGVD